MSDENTNLENTNEGSREEESNEQNEIIPDPESLQSDSDSDLSSRVQKGFGLTEEEPEDVDLSAEQIQERFPNNTDQLPIERGLYLEPTRLMDLIR